MKNHYIFRMAIFVTMFALLSVTAKGQSVPSDCFALEGIMSQFRNDADRLALRKIYKQELKCRGQINIPKIHSDSVLKALVAVYNAKTSPARDTVINLLRINSFNDFEMNRIMIAADPNMLWMQEIRKGHRRTGEPLLDSIIQTLDFNIESYFGGSLWHLVILKSENNYNLSPITRLLEQIGGVIFANPAPIMGDGSDIEIELFSDHIELVYSYGWGDCPSGCIYRRFWKFNVYYDCSVEFIDSYGDALYPPEPQPLPIPLPIPLPMPLTKSGEISETNAIAISVYPNPMKSYINIDGIDVEYSWTINNMFGQVVSSGISTTSRLDNLSGLTRGFYVLTIRTADSSTSFRILKD